MTVGRKHNRPYFWYDKDYNIPDECAITQRDLTRIDDEDEEGEINGEEVREVEEE